MSFKIISKEAFQAHISQAKEKSFLQSLEMAELLTKRGYTVTYIGWETNGQLEISALLQSIPMTGGFLMEINNGPVITNDKYLVNFYQELKMYAKKNGALELRLKPYEDYQVFDKSGQPLSDENKDIIPKFLSLGFQYDGLTTGYPNGEPTWHYVKELKELTPDNLISSFNTNAKRLLKKARQYPITIRPLEFDELDVFKNMQDDTALRQGYQAKELAYYQDFYNAFGEKCQFLAAFIHLGHYINELQEKIKSAPENNKLQLELVQTQKLIKAYGNGEVPIASILIIYDKQEATYLFGGFYPDFQMFNAPILLQEYAMLDTIQKNIPLYNFLGIAGVFDNSDGVLRFKQNFNGYITRKTGVFHYYPNPLKYKFLQGLKKILGR